jgi:hypothetical protein
VFLHRAQMLFSGGLLLARSGELVRAQDSRDGIVAARQVDTLMEVTEGARSAQPFPNIDSFLLARSFSNV